MKASATRSIWLSCLVVKFQNSSNFKLPFPLLVILFSSPIVFPPVAAAATGCHMFVHLHCHSHYSFLRGVNPPEEIIAAAVKLKMSAVALTDTNGMDAAVAVFPAGRAAGVKPIVGVVGEGGRRGPSGKIAGSGVR